MALLLVAVLHRVARLHVGVPREVAVPDERADLQAAVGAFFDAGQRARLAAVFANGVCDWTRPGVGQTDAVLTTFGEMIRVQTIEPFWPKLSWLNPYPGRFCGMNPVSPLAE